MAKDTNDLPVYEDDIMRVSRKGEKCWRLKMQTIVLFRAIEKSFLSDDTSRKSGLGYIHRYDFSIYEDDKMHVLDPDSRKSGSGLRNDFLFIT